MYSAAVGSMSSILCVCKVAFNSIFLLLGNGIGRVRGCSFSTFVALGLGGRLFLLCARTIICFGSSEFATARRSWALAAIILFFLGLTLDGAAFFAFFRPPPFLVLGGRLLASVYAIFRGAWQHIDLQITTFSYFKAHR